ncbi:MAG TPA: hypothetical protein RMH80_30155 [Polyangiaceae bacterium LLY-WYZ-15_(1-7)]|nr:hypothetical protein [Polyangiaceae bacterium LLY-WYZ-15_(1-7)]
MSSWSKKGEGFGGSEAGGEKAEAPPAEGAKAEAATPDAAAEPDAKPAADAKAEEKKEPVKPEGWGKRKDGTKAWSERARADDPDKRKVLAPTGTGIGDGKVFHFLFGLKIHSPNDRRLFGEAREHVDDDVEALRAAGYTVVVDEQAVHADFIGAVYGDAEDVKGLAPAGVFWLAHGHDDGAIETCDGGVVQPTDVDPEKVHAGLKLVVFAACYTGSCSRTWRERLSGRALVVGWGRPVTIDRAVEFLTPDDRTETDLDDLLRRYLLAPTDVPKEVEMRYSPLGAAAAAGRSGDLPKRLEGTVSILHAKVLPAKDGDAAVTIDVPMGDKRWHRAKIFIVDGNEPFAEGELLLGVECDVGELSNVVDPPMLLSGIPHNRYARVQLVESEKEMPRIVTQGFMPLARVRDMDAASLIFQVCQYADVLEHRIFGGDMG